MGVPNIYVRFHQLAIADVPFLRFSLTVGSTHLSVKYALGSNHLHRGWQSWKKEASGFSSVYPIDEKKQHVTCMPSPKKSLEHPVGPVVGVVSPRAARQKKEDLADAAEQNEENVPSDPRRQPFCYSVLGKWLLVVELFGL